MELVPDGSADLEIDVDTGEVTEEFKRGGGVYRQMETTSRELLEQHKANDRARVTGRPRIRHHWLRPDEEGDDEDKPRFALGEDGRLIEIDYRLEREDEQ